MSKIEIITNPTKEEIDADLEKADIVTVIHEGDMAEIRDFLNGYDNNEVKPVYCHRYTKDETYTIGLKMIKK